jgi:hypothetical protein
MELFKDSKCIFNIRLIEKDPLGIGVKKEAAFAAASFEI